MKRSIDPGPFNVIANDPAVRPWIGLGTGAVDLSRVVSNLDNVCFLTDDEMGGYILRKLQPGLYEAHTLALPSARGRPMLCCMREGFASMFMGTDALEIVTMVPDGNEAGSRWADVAGFREVFRREHFFDLNGEIVGGSFRSLHYNDWVLKDDRNERLGEAFHQQMEEARCDVGAPAHPKDPVHDRWAGATLQAAIEGNLQKAIVLYNRWALQAGYQISQIVSFNPPCVDIGDAIVQLNCGRLDVLKVKPAFAPQAV